MKTMLEIVLILCVGIICGILARYIGTLWMIPFCLLTIGTRLIFEGKWDD